ncbi:hypothetical protein ABIF72_008578 [Bradyrhizobium japonicum]
MSSRKSMIIRDLVGYNLASLIFHVKRQMLEFPDS